MNTDELPESTPNKATAEDDQEIIKVLEQSNHTVSALRKILDFTKGKPLVIDNNNKDDISSENDFHQPK